MLTVKFLKDYKNLYSVGDIEEVPENKAKSLAERGIIKIVDSRYYKSREMRAELPKRANYVAK